MSKKRNPDLGKMASVDEKVNPTEVNPYKNSEIPDKKKVDNHLSVEKLSETQKIKDETKLIEAQEVIKSLPDEAEENKKREELKKNQEVLLKTLERSVSSLKVNGLFLEVDEIGANGELIKLKFVGDKNKIFMIGDCVSDERGNVVKIVFRKKEGNPLKALVKRDKFTSAHREANMTYTEEGKLSTIELSGIDEEQKQILERSKFETDGSETQEIMNDQGSVDQEIKYYPDGLTEKDTKFSYRRDGTLRSNYSVEYEDRIPGNSYTQRMSSEPRYVYYDEDGSILAGLDKRSLESIRADADRKFDYTHARLVNPNKKTEEGVEEEVVRMLKAREADRQERMKKTRRPL